MVTINISSYAPFKEISMKKNIPCYGLILLAYLVANSAIASEEGKDSLGSFCSAGMTTGRSSQSAADLTTQRVSDLTSGLEGLSLQTPMPVPLAGTAPAPTTSLSDSASAAPVDGVDAAPESAATASLDSSAESISGDCAVGGSKAGDIKSRVQVGLRDAIALVRQKGILTADQSEQVQEIVAEQLQKEGVSPIIFEVSGHRNFMAGALLRNADSAESIAYVFPVGHVSAGWYWVYSPRHIPLNLECSCDKDSADETLA